MEVAAMPREAQGIVTLHAAHGGLRAALDVAGQTPPMQVTAPAGGARSVRQPGTAGALVAGSQ